MKRKLYKFIVFVLNHISFQFPMDGKFASVNENYDSSAVSSPGEFIISSTFFEPDIIILV